MPSPPMKRATMKMFCSGAIPEPTAETKYNIPIQISVGRRPNRSVGQPPSSAPSTVPHSAALMHNPCHSESSSQIACIFCSAPEITTASKPNKNPASAEIIDQINNFRCCLPAGAPASGPPRA